MAVDIITMSLVDFKEDRSTMQYFIQAGAAEADIQTYVNALVDSVDLVTGAVIESVAITSEFATFGTSPKTTPSADVNMERGVNFGYRVLASVYRHTIRVPPLRTTLATAKMSIQASPHKAFMLGLLVKPT